MSTSLFRWEELDKESKPHVPGPVKRRLVQIGDVTVPHPEEGTVAATKRVRKVGLAEAEKQISKYTLQAIRIPQQTDRTQTFGALDEEATKPADLCAPLLARTPLDFQLKRLFELVSGTKEGQRKDFFAELASGNIQEKRKGQIVREAKAVLFRDFQRRKRLKRIKSKAFRKYRRVELEKDKERVLERLEEEDPEAARKLRDEYETKRAELRMQKNHRARRRWAQMAARFGGKDAARLVTSQFQAAKDQKDVLDRLSGRRNFDHSDSEESNGGSSTSLSEDDLDDEANHTKEERLAKIIDRTAGKFADVLEETETLGKVSRGVRNMKFMKLGEEKRRADLAAEAERYLALLQQGYSDREATELAKEATKDDFVKGGNDLEDVHNASLSFREKKRNQFKKKQQANGLEVTSSTPESRVLLPKDDLGKIARVKDRNEDSTSILPETVDVTAQITKGLNSQSTRKTSSDRINTKDASKKVTFAMDAEDIKELMTGVKDDRSKLNEELVNLAFVDTDTHSEDFHTQQEEEAFEAAHSTPLRGGVLPGWGNWTGDGITKEKSVKEKQACEKATKTSARRTNVIYNIEPTKKTMTKFAPAQLPEHFQDAEQYNALMSQPIGREWLPIGTYIQAVEPRIAVRPGTVVAPMKYKSPKQLRKGLH